MPRRKTKEKVRLSPEQKREQRRLRREQRKLAPSVDVSSVRERSPQEEQQFWAGLNARANASRILNNEKARPYWLSILMLSGNPPTCGMYPCTMLARGNRWYYGFLFRAHRDRAYKQWQGDYTLRARKEFTGGKDYPIVR